MSMTPLEAKKILGVPSNSSSDTIRHAYRSKILLCHPDITGKKNYDDFIRLTEAYNTLKDTNKDLEVIDFDKIFSLFNSTYSFSEFYSKFNESFQPKKLESILTKLSMKKYDDARKIYIINPDNAKKYAENIKVTLQANISYKYDSDLSKHLDELLFYCNTLDIDYSNALSEISHAVLSKLEKELLKKQDACTNNFEEYLKSKFSLIDKVPLDTKKLEDKFTKKIVSQIYKEFDKSQSLDTITSSLNKLSVLDQYYSSEETPHKFINDSYKKFLDKWVGLVPKDNRKFVRSVLIEYNSRGITDAKEKLKYFNRTRSITND